MASLSKYDNFTLWQTIMQKPTTIQSTLFTELANTHLLHIFSAGYPVVQLTMYDALGHETVLT
jgi:hypothetical protein